MTRKRRSIPFRNVLGQLISEYGDEISRRDLIAFAREHDISLPSYIRTHNVSGSKTFFSLQALKKTIENGEETATRPSRKFDQMPTALSAYEFEKDTGKTDEEILREIESKYSILEMMTKGVVSGDFRAVIVSGNPGTGKTHTVEYILQKAQEEEEIQFEHVKGTIRATGLYRLLYQHRDSNSVILIDDGDSVFGDIESLNLMKGALDSSEKRIISWRSERNFETNDGEEIPKSFQFDGSMIFISNIDFDREIKKENRLSPHFEALKSRAYYLDMNMRTVRELVLLIENVVKKSNIMASAHITSKKDQETILGFLKENQKNFEEISLRVVMKLGQLWKATGGNETLFRNLAIATLCRNKKN